MIFASIEFQLHVIISNSFDNGFEVHWLFLNILKTFDEVWYIGLIFTFRENRILGKLLFVPQNFLTYVKQSVVLNASCLGKL